MNKNKIPKNVFQALVLVIASILLTSPILFFDNLLNSFLVTDAVNNVYFVSFLLIAISISMLINLRNKHPLHFNYGLIKKDLLLISIVIIFLFHLGFTQIVTDGFTYLLNKHTDDYTEINASKLVGALLLAPILEEVFFRGIILEGFLSHYRARNAIIISSVLFAICHGTMISAINTFFISLFISCIYINEKSLKMAVILHFLNNLIGLFFTFLRFKHTTRPGIQLYGSYTWVIYTIALILLIIMVRWLFKKYYPTVLFTKSS